MRLAACGEPPGAPGGRQSCGRIVRSVASEVTSLPEECHRCVTTRGVFPRVRSRPGCGDPPVSRTCPFCQDQTPAGSFTPNQTSPLAPTSCRRGRTRRGAETRPERRRSRSVPGQTALLCRYFRRHGAVLHQAVNRPGKSSDLRKSVPLTGLFVAKTRRFTRIACVSAPRFRSSCLALQAIPLNGALFQRTVNPVFLELFQCCNFLQSSFRLNRRLKLARGLTPRRPGPQSAANRPTATGFRAGIFRGPSPWATRKG